VNSQNLEYLQVKDFSDKTWECGLRANKSEPLKYATFSRLEIIKKMNFNLVRQSGSSFIAQISLAGDALNELGSNKTSDTLSTDIDTAAYNITML